MHSRRRFPILQANRIQVRGPMQPLDLTNCDRELIHIPGSIQPHGILVVIDLNSGIVLQAAGDTAGILATQHPPLGKPVHDLLGVRGRYRATPSSEATVRAVAVHPIFSRLVTATSTCRFWTGRSTTTSRRTPH